MDRDGTVLNERGYLSHAGPLKIYKSAVRGMKILSKAAFKLVVVTNQSGVGRGLIELEELNGIHGRLIRSLKRCGVHLAGIYFCPHSPGAGCQCRKPRPGLARRAARDLGIDLKKSYVIGDHMKDIGLARRIGAKGILVLTGAGLSHIKEGREAG